MADAEYYTPTPKEACLIIKQKLKEHPKLEHGWNSAIWTALTQYEGAAMISNNVDAMQGAGAIMVAIAVALMEPDPSLMGRAFKE